MREGARPATDIYRPAEQDRPVEGRFPVIRNCTPYDKNGPAEESFFARCGGVILAQDCRGRYAFEGSFYTCDRGS